MKKGIYQWFFHISDLRFFLVILLSVLVVHQVIGKRENDRNVEISPDREEYRFAGPTEIYNALVKKGQGRVTVTPETGLTAGEAFTLRMEYPVGEEPLNPGDAFVVIIPYSFPMPTSPTVLMTGVEQ